MIILRFKKVTFVRIVFDLFIFIFSIFNKKDEEEKNEQLHTKVTFLFNSFDISIMGYLKKEKA